MQTIVNVREGQLEGCLSADQKTLIFKGVPYAEPPVGELRWKRPQPKTPWDGVRSAKAFSAKAPQADLTREGFYAKEFYTEETIERNEDCLYLNIWTPAEKTEEKLPVFFWIHGGAFLHGCGAEKEFDGEQFSKNGVIMVSINYRVGALGFMVHPALAAENPEGLTGNYGIFDQIAALNWVYDNIEAFGGDPDKITVAGQSAGCMSVQILISSPLTKGKIKRAVLQSGGGLNGLTRGNTSVESRLPATELLMKALGAETIDDMRKIPAEKIAEVQYTINTGGGLGWVPVTDGYLLPASTDEQALTGEIHDIDYMIGSTGNDIGFEDRMLEKSAVHWAKNQLKLERNPSYLYYFNRKLPGDDAGAFHSCELWYVFHTLDRAWRPWEDCDRALEAVVSAYWANFAKTGDPNGEGLPVWHPYTDETPVQILLAETVSEQEAIKVD
ncbi:MAG: carboxylesterase family protein [Clostridia bacterium]|nr:carboxylesterase family protein [Clostridia bacterium]